MFRRYLEPFIMFITLTRWLVIATVIGGVVGTGASFFLLALLKALRITESVSLPLQMGLLPLAGLLNGLIIYYGYRHFAIKNKDSFIAAFHEQGGKLPYKTFLLKPIAALVTLGFGGSAGKEGPCSHIGGSLASMIGRALHLNPELQRRVMALGICAGFASVFGTPIAGAIYGIEVLVIGRLRYDFLFPAIITGFISYKVSLFWGLTYDYFPLLVVEFSDRLFLQSIGLGLSCGLAAWLFIELFDRCRQGFLWIQKRFSIWEPLMPFLGGLLLAFLLLFISTDYLSLSLPVMDRALWGEEIEFLGFFWKALFVAITLGSGFYGGIVTPQFVIGALAGNAFAPLFGVDPSFGAAIGMVAVVASASNTPLAAFMIGFEIFGGSAGVYMMTACLTAYVISGHRSVYPDQVVVYSKSLLMKLVPNQALSREQVHISYGLLKALRRRR